MKILVCGLPGSGKTWLAGRLVDCIENCAWYNADVIRKASNDWDFSDSGRIRQANRMKTFADFEIKNGRSVICDFVAPTTKSREAFNPDFVIWLNTIDEGRVVDKKVNELKDAKDLPFEIHSLQESDAFKDTTSMFQPPLNAQRIIKSFLNDEQIQEIAKDIKNV